VGFQDVDGMVIPISLACISANGGSSILLSPGVVYQLLVTDSEAFLHHHQQQQQQQQEKHEGIGLLQAPHQQSPAYSPVGVTPTSSSTSSVPTLAGAPRQPPPPQPPQQPASTTQLSWQEPVGRFLHVLAGQGVLTPDEHAVLQALVGEGHIVLAAAYRAAAARGGNRELLAAVLKRVAQQEAEDEEEGGVLEEQGEMLRMLGHVVEEGLVTPTQHTRLVRVRMWIGLCAESSPCYCIRNQNHQNTPTAPPPQECLVLLQHERIYGVFNAYTETGDADAFCDGLAALGDGAEGLIAVRAFLTFWLESVERKVGEG
jgi:hypothetical protein